MGRSLRWLFLIGLLVLNRSVQAQEVELQEYPIGTPVVQTIWVDPVLGNDNRTGATRALAIRTITEAWARVPRGQTLTGHGYRILLTAGEYPRNAMPNYWEERYGTQQFPVILEAADGARTAILRGDLNLFDVRYLYLIGLRVDPLPAGDAVHCELCNTLLIRNCELNGATSAQETLKVNQSQYVYIEDSKIHGAYDNAIDFVSVQYGHIRRNDVYGADDWCTYVKGGSAYIVIDGNIFHDCGTGGVTAGQGTGFEFMTSPWLHFEAYDVKIVNNIIHHTEGAGIGINGGYNVLAAYNTMYRVGARSHTIEVVFGARSCDGNMSKCQEYLNLGGWGQLGNTEEQHIGNRNVFILNNIVYNPSGTQSGTQHFAIYGPRNSLPGSNVPSPVPTDVNLKIQGNIIWNGPPSYPLGIEEASEGCRPSNPTCNETQLLAQNSINTIQPQLINPEAGDFRPVADGNLTTVMAATVPSFAGGDRETTPLAPQGILINSIAHDYDRHDRGISPTPGAYNLAQARRGADTYLPWNGFLAGINVLEISNSGLDTQNIRVTLYSNAGEAQSSRTLSLAAGGQFDVIINELAGFSPTTYGLVGVEHGPTIRGRMTVYRGTLGTASFDFAYAHAFAVPLQGNSAVGCNTYPIHDAAGRVENWLSIVNLDLNDAATFDIASYDEAGALVRERSITVPPFGRMDLEAGHELFGPQRVGLHEIRPRNASQAYLGFLTRYGAYATGGYAFAIPLRATQGGMQTQVLPVSTGAGAQAWIELQNTAVTTQQATISVYRNDGTLVLTRGIQIAARSQYHLPAHEALGSGTSGYAILTADQAPTLTATLFSYFVAQDAHLESAYAAPAQALSSGTLSSSYNLFLHMSNWLRVRNPSDSPVQTTVHLVHANGSQNDVPLVLAPHTGVDLGLHEPAPFGTTPDSYGSVSIQGTGLVATVLRIKPDVANSIDFAFETPAN